MSDLPCILYFQTVVACNVTLPSVSQTQVKIGGGVQMYDYCAAT